MDKELIAYLDERFARMEERAEKNQAETNRRFARLDALLDQFEHHGRLERCVELTETTDRRYAEIGQQIDDLKVLIVAFYESLESNVEAQRATRETRDIMDVIREKYGRPQKTT